MLWFKKALFALSLAAAANSQCAFPDVDADWSFDVYGDYGCSEKNHHEWFHGSWVDWSDCFNISPKIPKVKSFRYLGNYDIYLYQGHNCTGKQLGWAPPQGWLEDRVSEEGQTMRSFKIPS